MTGARGLHVTAAERDLWRARLEDGPYRRRGDAYENSPADGERLDAHAAAYLADPEASRWAGPTHAPGHPIVVSSRWPRDETGAPPRRGGPERLRDAAFVAMLRPDRADELHARLVPELLWHVRSPALDFTDRDRFRVSRVGGRSPFRGYHPAFQITAWLRKLAYAFDYVRVADPAAFGATEERAVLEWLGAAAAWIEPQVEQRRRGMWRSDGRPSRLGELPLCRSCAPVWAGGPRTRLVQHLYNNHVNRMATFLTDVGLLTDDDRLQAHGRRWIREFLTVAVYPEGAISDFNRWTDDKSHLQGWKYGMEMIGSTLVIADHLARAGDPTGYEAATTAGTSDTAGSVPDDGVTSGGPKTLHSTTRRLLAFIDEEQPPARYAARRPGDPSRRISSRDTRSGVLRSDDWLVLQGNVRFRDPYIRSIYRRERPGTPPHPSEPAHGLGWVHDGDAGTFPAVNLMFADVEGTVWPYPSPEPGSGDGPGARGGAQEGT